MLLFVSAFEIRSLNMVSFSKAIKMKDVCNITTEMSLLYAFVNVWKLLKSLFKHLCESRQDSKTFQGLAALFHTPLSIMARTTVPNLSLMLFDLSVHTERMDKPSEHVNTSYYIHWFKFYQLCSELMVAGWFKWHQMKHIKAVFSSLVCLSTSLQAHASLIHSFILERERFYSASTGVCLIHQSLKLAAVSGSAKGIFPLKDYWWYRFNPKNTKHLIKLIKVLENWWHKSMSKAGDYMLSRKYV